MRIDGYQHVGGKHIESTVLANALAHAGVVDPSTKEPFSEAAVFGIAGGIGAGLSFCPSVLRYGLGAGISVVARHRSAACDGGWHRGMLGRLGIPYEVTESSSPKAAQKKLRAELEKGAPVIVQCSRGLPYYGPPSPSCGLMEWAWDVIVVGMDEDAGVAEVGDLAPGTLTVPLDDLARARNQTCSHKNRLFRLERPGRKLAVTAVRKAVLDGLAAGVEALREPRVKTFSLDGLAAWGKSVGNFKAKSGWLRTFPDGKLFWALRDVFKSVELDDGGGLMRPMFGDFLDEAARVTRKKALGAAADAYRALGAQWSELAEAALPNRVKEFKQSKTLMRKQARLFADKGAKAARQMDKNRAVLADLERAVLADFPLDSDAVEALLGDLGGRIAAVHEAEVAALERLAAAL